MKIAAKSISSFSTSSSPKAKDLFDPILIIICLLAAFFLWAGRKAFMGLLN